MKPRLPDPSSPIAPHIVAFVGHKRALNRRYDVEDKVLRMFDGYLNTAGIMTLAEITPAAVDAFFLSRTRTRPRSFNHLVGVIGRLFEWMVEHGIVVFWTCEQPSGLSTWPDGLPIGAPRRSAALLIRRSLACSSASGCA
jgi:hypothetical protein